MRKLTTLLLSFVLLLLFSINSSIAQREYINAQNLQQLSQAEFNSLNALSSGLSVLDKKDWDNLSKFYNDPDGYISDKTNPIFDPNVLTKLRNLKLAGLTSNNVDNLTSQDTNNVIFSNGPTPQSQLFSPEMVSKTIYALGQLLLERAKQELYSAHFQQMVETFNKPIMFGSNGYEHEFTLAEVLPNMYGVMADFNQVVQPQLGETLQKAFELDLRQFHDNMMNYMIPDKIKAHWPYIFLKLIFDSIEQLNEGKHASGIIKDLAWKFQDYGSGSNLNDTQRIAIGINVLNMISESLLRQGNVSKIDISIDDSKYGNDEANSSYWIGSKEFSQLGINGYKYYIGFLYLNHPILFEALKIEPAKVIQTGDSAFRKFKLLVEETLVQIEWVESNLQKLKAEVERLGVEQDGENRNLDNILDYSKSVTALLQNIRPSVCAFMADDEFCKADFTLVLDQIETSLSIPTDIKNKEYAEAFLKSYKTGKVLFEHFAKNDTFAKNSNLIRYLTLANDIVQADSIDQIKTIFDAAIMPVGSYKEKRILEKTTTINAYVGITGGYEKILNSELNTGGAHFGPFAPVGIDFSWASKKNRSNGIFISIIDLGAVVNMYFGGNDKIDTTSVANMTNMAEFEIATLPELSIKSIIAPGLFYTHGMKNSPVSMGIGAQFAPDLRQVSLVNGADLFNENSVRFSFFFGVDIPLVPLARGGRKNN